MQSIKTNNIYFPLCLLNYNDAQTQGENHISTPSNVPDTPTIAGKLISYGIVEYAKKLQGSYIISKTEENEIVKYTLEQKISGHMSNKTLDRYIILAAICLGIRINNLKRTKLNHRDLHNFHASFENTYGKDAKVKIHKDVLLEVSEKSFDERMFRVYCGVLSVIGKKPFVRITIRRIRYAMLGCKSENVFNEFIRNPTLLTARQVKTTIDKLVDRGFFDFFTHKNRMTYYSTQFREADLEAVLAEEIARRKLKSARNRLKSEMLSSSIDARLKELRGEFVKNYAVRNENTPKLELLNCSAKC